MSALIALAIVLAGFAAAGTVAFSRDPVRRVLAVACAGIIDTAAAAADHAWWLAGTAAVLAAAGVRVPCRPAGRKGQP